MSPNTVISLFAKKEILRLKSFYVNYGKIVKMPARGIEPPLPDYKTGVMSRYTTLAKMLGLSGEPYHSPLWLSSN